MSDHLIEPIVFVKFCKGCEKDCPSTSFYKRKGGYLTTLCKVCHNINQKEYNKVYNANNRDKVNAAQKKWNLKNPDKIKEYAKRAYRKKHPKVCLKHHRSYYKKHYGVNADRAIELIETGQVEEH